MKEIYKDIPGYEGLYQVSNLGNVKSLEREVSNGKGTYIIKENILKPNTKIGYAVVGLFINGKRKRFYVHQLVAIVFLNHTINGFETVVDHIDNNPLNNNINNLQLLSNRENSSKDKWKYNPSSKYVGVYLNRNKITLKDGSTKIVIKWIARIYINGKRELLGSFKNEELANDAYQNKLKEINQK
jgi:hypothetical protein